MSGTEERELPLTLPSNSGQVGDVVDLSEWACLSCGLHIFLMKVQCGQTALELTIQYYYKLCVSWL